MFLKVLQRGLVCFFYLRTRLLTWIFWCEIIGILGIIIIILSSGWFGRFLGIFSVILVTLGSDIVVYKSILVKYFLKLLQWELVFFLLPVYQIINLDFLVWDHWYPWHHNHYPQLRLVWQVPWHLQCHPRHPRLWHSGIQKYISQVFLKLLQ